MFEGDGIIVLAKHVNEPPPPLVSPHGDVPPELAAFVQGQPQHDDITMVILKIE